MTEPTRPHIVLELNTPSTFLPDKNSIQDTICNGLRKIFHDEDTQISYGSVEYKHRINFMFHIIDKDYNQSLCNRIRTFANQYCQELGNHCYFTLETFNSDWFSLSFDQDFFQK